MNVHVNWQGWRALLLPSLLLSSGCAHNLPAPCPPPVTVKPVLPPVVVKPEGYFQVELEKILAPYSVGSSSGSPSRPTTSPPTSGPR